MGTEITLSIDNLEIDWGKNQFYNNHSKLFLPNDIKSVKYHYAEEKCIYKKAYSRKLAGLIRRLELLGYSYNNVKRLYAHYLKGIPEYYTGRKLKFETLLEILRNIDVSKVNIPSGSEYCDLGEFVYENILPIKECACLVNSKKYNTKELSELLENIDPYIVLRLLLQNPKNNKKQLVWRFADMLESGWLSMEEIHENLSQKEKYLIVTEGSSDIFVIKKAFQILMPEISDFFCYVDMENEYPFTGTGNIYRFSQGLASIGIMNKILIIYDNDAEGNDKFELSKKLRLPSNMVIMKLPEMKDFRKISSIGPNGTRLEDINGKAVSIECYLDLTYKTNKKPLIRWNNYISKNNTYQGALINKEIYTRLFKNVDKNTKNYNFSKLRILLETIYDKCINIPNY